MLFRLFSLLVLLASLQGSECASQECVDLLPDLLDACPAFEYARSNDLSLSVTEGNPPVRRQDGASLTVQALDKIKAQNFDEGCCEFLSRVNTSRCFCEDDVVEALQSDMKEELLGFTIFTAARPLPGGCGGSIWAALDGEQCLPLGPMSDTGSSVSSGCLALPTLLRDPRNVRDSIALFSEALDATDFIDTLVDMNVVTIFAPTDTAFVNFAEKLGVTVSELLGNTKILLPILEGHVIENGLVRTDEVTQPISIEALNKNELLLDTTSSGGVTVEGTPIIQADIDICNGILHAVSAVLVEFPSQEPMIVTPEQAAPVVISRTTGDDVDDQETDGDKATDESVDEVTTSDEEDVEVTTEGCENNLFSLLVSFEEAFGILINEVEKVEDLKAILQGPGPVTLFAPINSELEVEKMVNGEPSLEETAVTLRRLVVEGDVKGESLEPGTVLTTLGGEEIEATLSDGNIKINGVSIIQADISACNGRLFIIESPLPPKADEEEEEKVVDEKEEEKVVDEKEEEKVVDVNEEVAEEDEEEEVREVTDESRAKENLEKTEVEEDEEEEVVPIASVSPADTPEEKPTESTNTSESAEIPKKAPSDGTPKVPDEDEEEESGSETASKPMPTARPGSEEGDVKKTGPKNPAPSPTKQFDPIDDDPRRIVIRGAGKKSDEEFNEDTTGDAVDENTSTSPASIESSSDPCGCSATGISSGIQTDRPGCGQHLLDMGDPTIFCYIEEPEECMASDEYVEMNPSIKFEPGFWKVCEKEEIMSLPTLAELLGSELDSLSPVWRIFVYSELDMVLKEDGPFTVFVPSRTAVAGALTQSLLDGSSSDNSGLKKIMKRHIIKGEFTLEDLHSETSVTTLDGEQLGMHWDENGRLLIGGAVSIEVGDMLGSNGIAHIVDDFIFDNLTIERTVSVEEACSCSLDGFSGTLQTGRSGCDTHIVGEAPFCYVKHPDECHLATDSIAFPGAKWLPCKDPCNCSKNGVSGSVDTGRPGCARHIMGTASFCYVTDPEKCKYATPSEAFETAAWKWCESAPILSRFTSVYPGTAVEDVSHHPCTCAEDGISGGVITGKRGCGRHGVLFALFDTCYVKDPANCHKSFTSLRCHGAGWRFC